jgi:type I restriction enzyme S subunit
MEKYKSYKPLSIEWLGEIPDHWEIKKFKHLYSSGMGNTILKEDLIDDGEIPVYSATEEDTIFGYVNETKLILNKGDIVIPARGNSIGHIMLVDTKSTCTQTTIYSKRNFESLVDKFSFYFLKGCQKYLFQFDNTAIPQITVGQIKENTILLPPLNEQLQIVKFLDEKTELIDKLISTKEQKIDLLKHQRTSLIKEVITKGLNSNVEMKDSGIEWIGEIPKHWRVLPLKYFGLITLGKMLTPEEKDGYILKPYLRSQNIQIDKVDISDIKEMWFSDNELQKLRLQKGDLLINEGGDVGRTSIWNEELEECYFQNSVNRVRFNEKTESIYYFLYQSHLFHNVGYYSSYVNGVSISHLTKEKLESVRFLRPPFNEQKQIFEYLNIRTKEIDELVLMEQKKIDLLKEYRQSLISEVITGKIDVRTNLN